MDTSYSVLLVWSYGLAALGYLAFASYFVHMTYTGLASKALSAALVLSGLWAACGVLFAFTGNPALLNLHFILDVFRYAAWFACLILLTTDSETDPSSAARRKRHITIAGFILLSCLSGQILAYWLGKGTASAGVIRLTQFAALAMVVYGLILVEQLFRNISPDSRWNYKPLALGLAGVFIFDLHLYSDTVLFNRVDDDVFSIRGFVHALIVPLIALSVARNKHRTLRISLSQTAAFHSTTLVVVGVYLIFVAVAGYYVRYFGGNWGRALQIVVFFAAFLLLLLLSFSGSIRARLRVLVGKHFFRYRYDYRQEWLKFTNALSASESTQEVGKRIVKGLADMVESPGGSLWVKSAESGEFCQIAAWNIPHISQTVSPQSTLIRFFNESGWVLNLEEYRHMPKRYEGLALPDWVASVPNVWLMVPLSTGLELVGFVLLTTARTDLDVDWEVNDLLKTAGRQAASFIAQMQATEALLEARKFDSFNKMSAFVVHDLKNIITQLSLMVKNAERHRDNPEFQRDMLETVQHSVERMRQLMLQLREGATPVAGSFGIDLVSIAERVRDAKKAQLPLVELTVKEKLSARGHEERVERVIGHMVQNALDATTDNGRVWITLGRKDGFAMVEVGDTGQGMTPEFMREKLFKPFQTTKQAGMGIGAYESFQYIQELGGKIQVDSELNRGTRITMLLPLFDAHSQSVLQSVESR